MHVNEIITKKKRTRKSGQKSFVGILSQFAFIKPFTMGNSLDLSFFRPDTVFYLRVGKYNFPPTFLVTQDINGLRESFVFF